jgi:uncharacterized membrane protein
MNLPMILFLMAISTSIGSFGSIFLKLGSDRFHVRFTWKSFIGLIKNWHLIVGAVLYLLSTIAFIYMLKTEDLSLIYPLSSMSYIFVTILSIWLLKEHMNIYKYIGIGFIVLGVVLVTFRTIFFIFLLYITYEILLYNIKICYILICDSKFFLKTIKCCHSPMDKKH